MRVQSTLLSLSCLAIAAVILIALANVLLDLGWFGSRPKLVLSLLLIPALALLLYVVGRIDADE